MEDKSIVQPAPSESSPTDPSAGVSQSSEVALQPQVEEEIILPSSEMPFTPEERPAAPSPDGGSRTTEGTAGQELIMEKMEALMIRGEEQINKSLPSRGYGDLDLLHDVSQKMWDTMIKYESKPDITSNQE